MPVRFEDDHLAVVAKPAGLVTHPTAGRRGGTLVNRLLGMGVPLAPAGGTLRPGIVHRLDAGTSGLLVVAKTDEAYASLRAPVPRPRRRSHVPRARPGRRRERRVRGRGAARTARLEDRGRRDRGQARGDRFDVRERLRERHASWRPCPGRDGPTRSASTSRRSGIRSSATAPTAAGETTRAASGSSARSSTPWRLSFAHPVTHQRDLARGRPPGRSRAAALERLR